jgi:hypothetical protein
VNTAAAVDESLAVRLAAEGPLLARICARLAKEVAAVGLPAIAFDAARAEFSLSADSFSGDVALMGRWPVDAGGRRGNLVIHGDGSYFIEHDVLANLPADAKRFVEAVTAWGRGERMGAELRILDWPDEE